MAQMIDTPNPPRIALAHDWLVGLRGGEWVLDRLAQLFGPTDLYTLVNDGRPLTDAIDACNVITSGLQKLPGASGRLRRAYLPFMPRAVNRLNVAPCDLLISTSSAVMKSIKPPPNAPHLCYCHSPARYIWGQTDDYATGAGGRLRSFGLRAIRKRFQAWDKRTADRVTRFLANSAHTAKKIKRSYDRDADVVYPPVRTDRFTIAPDVEREDWMLVVSALEPYKRTDIALEAANQAGFPLKIAGGGSQLEELTRRAKPNVEMLGRVSEDDLLDLYRRARVLIFPQVEDFGIVPLEAQATGCPVIAFAAGGALETVTESTGAFFDRQETDALLDAINAFEAKSIDAAACRANALRFSEAAFDANIMRHVDDLLSG